MTSVSSLGEYLIVSPVKDEAQFLESTIQSVLSQTVLPARWMIVDDGSCDRTPEIIRAYADKMGWILGFRVERDRERRLGSAESRAFEIGYELVRKNPHNFVVKLDGDVVLPPDYFENMLFRFRQNERLGIASGVYLEQRDGEWRTVAMPTYHATGAAKMVRTECFNAIGGFPTSPGWDTVDEIKAWSRGWETMHFPEIQLYHLKPEGSAQGSWKTARLHGEVYYVCGGGKLFFLLKVLQRLLFGKPFVLSGLSLLYGYLRAAAMRRPKLVSPEEEALYRRVLNERIFHRTTGRVLRSAQAEGLAGKA